MTARRKHVEDVLEDSLGRHRVPGASLAVIENATITGQYTRGLADAATGTPVTAATVFEAASLTKPVYAYMALGLHQQGVLDLDEPLGEYLPQPYIDDERVRLITMRDVLRHTPGFPNWRPKGGPLELRNEPGTRFSYSGEGYRYLQTVIETVTGSASESLVAERVLEPLGMEQSSLVWQPRFEGLLAGRHNADGAPQGTRARHEANAASTLYTTPLEYGRFLLAVLGRAPRFPFELSTDILRETVAPQVSAGSGCAWGLGWGIDVSVADDPVIWHWGDNSGYKNLVAASINMKSGGVMMTNGDTGLFVEIPVLETVLGRRLEGIRRFLIDTYSPFIVRRCCRRDFADMYEIVNGAAAAYKGVIPAHNWREPYMPRDELEGELRAGVEFWGYEDESGLASVMGTQDVEDVTLIRHAYTRPDYQRRGIGTTLLKRLRKETEKPVLVGTWAAASWAVNFYEKNGFKLIPTVEQKNELLLRYWSIPATQREFSVVLADQRWWERQA